MPIWNSASYPSSCNSGPLGPTGATGPSIIYVGGNTGVYNAIATSITMGTATRMNEHAFQVSGPSNIFLFHYNMVLIPGSGAYGTQITTTLGINSSASASATSSKNVYTGNTPVALTGANSDAYIAGSNGTVAAGSACNIIGQGTITGLSAGTYYVTLWAGSILSITAVSPTANLVVLQIQ